MELLNSIQRDTLDPEYAELAAGGHAVRSRAPWLVVVVGLLAGLMFTTSGLSGGQSAGAAAERSELIVQIDQADQRTLELRTQAAELSAEITELENTQLGPGSQPGLEVVVWSGASQVRGPGVLLTINDNPRDANGILIDQDLRHVVNGLWLAGAEAIAINGHRLSARTAIRQAGSAVTVDYRSMTTPYRIEAIGDPAELNDGFLANSGGAWLNFLRRNYGVQWAVESKASLELRGDAGLDVQEAGVP